MARKAASLVVALAAMLAAAFASAACAGDEGAEPMATANLVIATQGGDSHAFVVEIAATPAQRARGLMHRSELDPYAGMLFDFGRDQRVSMWMKNTLIPLDMLFVARDGRIVKVAERTTPLSIATISSEIPVRAVVELAGGTAERLGVAPGDRIVAPTFD